MQSVWRQLGLNVDKYEHQLIIFLKTRIKQQQKDSQFQKTQLKQQPSIEQKIDSFIHVQHEIKNIFHLFEDQLRFKLSSLFFQLTVKKTQEQNLKKQMINLEKNHNIQINKRNQKIQEINIKLQQMNSLIKIYEKALIGKKVNSQNNSKSPIKYSQTKQLDIENQQRKDFHYQYAYNLCFYPETVCFKNNNSNQSGVKLKLHTQNSPLSNSTLNNSRFTYHYKNKIKQELKQRQINQWNNSINLNSKNTKCSNSNLKVQNMSKSRMTDTRFSIKSHKRDKGIQNQTSIRKQSYFNSNRKLKQSDLSKSFCI